MTSWLSPGLFSPRDARAWPFRGLNGAPDLEPQAYSFIMADPPWLFELYSERGEGKSAQAHYECMALEEIAALPVADLARDDCLLWCWGTAPMLDQQIGIVKAWGFKYVSAGAWDKERWGTGYVWRSFAEFIILAKRGKPDVHGASVPNLIRGGAAGHSRKPDVAYQMAERMMPNVRRCSLFERPERPGWEGWGKEYGRPPPGKPGRKRKPVSEGQAADGARREPAAEGQQGFDF